MTKEQLTRILDQAEEQASSRADKASYESTENIKVNQREIYKITQMHIRYGVRLMREEIERLIVIAGIILLLSSCTTTKYVTVPEIHTDTTYITQHHRDSIYLHDSLYIHQKGDTVIFEKYHTEWRDRWRTDTIYKSKTDTIAKPYPVTEYVERELTKWQSFRLTLGDIALFVIAAIIIFRIILKTH